MSEARESTTIFYKLKLKRTRKPIDVFEKMAKAVNKRGATKKWNCHYNEQSFIVEFGDDLSQTFSIQFNNKKICEYFCKVYFPLSGELFENEKKSEFKALINMIYSARTFFSEMNITDDYGISESFLDSKVNKIVLRELDVDELERAKRLFNNGHISIEEFITALMFDLRNIPYSDDYIPYINCHISQNMLNFWRSDHELFFYYEAFIESFLYETAMFKNQNRIYNIPEYYGDLNSMFFSVLSFFFGILNLTGVCQSDRVFDPKSSQVYRLYKNRYLPLIDSETNQYERCKLAYRYFISIFEYLGFNYIGRTDENIDYISSELVHAIKLCLDDNDSVAHKAFEETLEKEIKMI